MIHLNIPSKEDIRTIIQEEYRKCPPVMISEEDRFLSKKEAANFISGSQSTVDNLRRAGIINAVYLSDGSTRGKPVFLKSDLKKALLEMNKKQSL